MAKTYKKNSRNVYVLPFYSRIFFWIVVFSFLGLFFLSLAFVFSKRYFGLLALVAMFISFGLIIKVLLNVGVRIANAGSIKSYLLERQCEGNVTKSLLATMTVNQLKDTPYISVPNVRVFDKTPSHLILEIEKLAGMYDLERLTEDADASFRGKKVGSYATTSSMISDDGVVYTFILENVGDDKTWRPATFQDLVAESHVIKLQEDVIVNLADTPGIGVFGKSGSRKTTLLYSIIAQAFGMGADCRFIDGKREFSSFIDFYPEEKIATDTQDVLKVLRDVVDELDKRQKIVAEGQSKSNQMGIRGYDLGLVPLILIADEVGAVMSAMTSKEKKEAISLLSQIAMKGRAVSCFLVTGSQSPKSDTTLPTEIRQQFGTKILLGASDKDIQRMVFDGDVATKSTGVPAGQGFYLIDGLTQPKRFFVADLYTPKLLTVSTFRELYKIGKNKTS